MEMKIVKNNVKKVCDELGVDFYNNSPWVILTALIKLAPIGSNNINIMNFGEAGLGKSFNYQFVPENSRRIVSQVITNADLRGNKISKKRIPLLNFPLLIVEEKVKFDSDSTDTLKTAMSSKAYYSEVEDKEVKTHTSIVSNFNAPQEIFQNFNINFELLREKIGLEEDSFLTRFHFFVPHFRELGEYKYIPDKYPSKEFMENLLALRKTKLDIKFWANNSRANINKNKALEAILKIVYMDNLDYINSLPEKIINGWANIVEFFSYRTDEKKFITENSKVIFSEIFFDTTVEKLWLSKDFLVGKAGNNLYRLELYKKLNTEKNRIDLEKIIDEKYIKSYKIPENFILGKEIEEKKRMTNSYELEGRKKEKVEKVDHRKREIIQKILDLVSEDLLSFKVFSVRPSEIQILLNTPTKYDIENLIDYTGCITKKIYTSSRKIFQLYPDNEVWSNSLENSKKWIKFIEYFSEILRKHLNDFNSSNEVLIKFVTIQRKKFLEKLVVNISSKNNEFSLKLESLINVYSTVNQEKEKIDLYLFDEFLQESKNTSDFFLINQDTLDVIYV
ncbi:MAG: hypothetical protein KGV57_02295 [Fusobacterium sp.]|nr:hypothetical protein [Fusobacterium sp.]